MDTVVGATPVAPLMNRVAAEIGVQACPMLCATSRMHTAAGTSKSARPAVVSSVLRMGIRVKIQTGPLPVT